MYIELLPQKGNFYKVNMHCHTDISDGKMTCEQVKEHYKALGYSAVCFTDHEILMSHKDLCDEDFIALHGYEVCIEKDLEKPHGNFAPLYHFNFIAKSQDNLKMPRFFKNNPSSFGNARSWWEKCAVYDETIDATYYDTDWLNDYLGAISNGGFLINYNHPQWSLQTRKDYVRLKHIHSIELINGGAYFLGDSTPLHFEQMLRAGMRVCPTAGDDNHGAAEIGLAWTMIKASKLSYSALIDAYERGDCYATEGPEIHSLVIENGKIKVRTSQANAIVLLGSGRYWKFKSSSSETFTEAEFDYVPEKLGKYLRIEVRDAAGRKAYSNAYFTDDIENKIKNT